MNLRRLSESEKRKGKKIRATRAIEDKEDSFPTRIVFLSRFKRTNERNIGRDNR